MHVYAREREREVPAEDGNGGNAWRCILMREREREREQFGVWMVRERAQSSPFLSNLYILAALHFNHKLKILKFSKILN